jgi:hypothetical protein
VGKDTSLTSTNKDCTLRRCSKEQVSVQGPSPHLHSGATIAFYQARLKPPNRSINTYVFPLYTLILIFVCFGLHYQQPSRPHQNQIEFTEWAQIAFLAHKPAHFLYEHESSYLASILLCRFVVADSHSQSYSDGQCGQGPPTEPEPVSPALSWGSYTLDQISNIPNIVDRVRTPISLDICSLLQTCKTSSY